MTVWLKIVLLLIYLSVLFILARMLEAMSWFEQGQLSVRLLDPMALSVLKLKALLEQRGVAYESILEKSDLADLVEASGIITDGEVESVSELSEDTAGAITNFRGDLHFYEQVEDAKDSMWLVEVLTEQGGLLSDTSWQIIQNKLGKFGVRFGRFDCQQDQMKRRFCFRKQWYHTQLVLALPDANTSKANVALHSYDGPVRVNALFEWIKVKVNAKTTKIQDIETYKSSWEGCLSTFNPEVNVVLISTLSSIPLFLSALSVRFPGRVKIGNVVTSEEEGQAIEKQLKINKTPAYLVLTCDRTYLYGQGHSENLNYQSMELFLKMLFPNVNDLFIVSIVLTNIACLFELSLAGGTIVRHIVRTILCVFQYNFVILITWVLLLGVIQISLFEKMFMIMLRGLQLITSTHWFSFIRADLLFYQSRIYIPLFILALSLYVVYVYKKRFMPDHISDEESDWWNFSSLRTLDYEQWWEITRLRPFDQIFNPTMGVLSVGGEPLDIHNYTISKDYIQQLPSWVYKGDVSFSSRDDDNKVPQSHSVTKSVSGVDYFETSPEDDTAGMNQMPSDDVNELAESALDSNYQCECEQTCLCTNDQRNPQPKQNPTNLHQETSPSIGPDEAILQAASENIEHKEDAARGVPDSIKGTTNGCPPGFIECNQCCICLDSYKPFVLLRGLPCGHTFHDKCILTWLLRENHICPVCRWPAFKLKTGAIHWDTHSD